MRLLLRSTRALALTAEGHAYLCGARRVLADLDDVEQEGLPTRARRAVGCASARPCRTDGFASSRCSASSCNDIRTSSSISASPTRWSTSLPGRRTWRFVSGRSPTAR